MYIQAKAGPMEHPIILRTLLTPIITPEYSCGLARIITFIAPILANERPADNIVKLIEILNS